MGCTLKMRRCVRMWGEGKGGVSAVTTVLTLLTNTRKTAKQKNSRDPNLFSILIEKKYLGEKVFETQAVEKIKRKRVRTVCREVKFWVFRFVWGWRKKTKEKLSDLKKNFGISKKKLWDFKKKNRISKKKWIFLCAYR